ncbi:inner membrane protein that interacts with cell division proteins [Escherichia coli]|uniref:Inner membrane protein that interacts with cell division proteins n=1 Tax=Escherichia coli TaxID=562 RepID=A0A2X1KV05_ECOLX|nr:inner membrane protein that interacts with cell division proteins [Escherichia coli]
MISKAIVRCNYRQLISSLPLVTIVHYFVCYNCLKVLTGLPLVAMNNSNNLDYFTLYIIFSIAFMLITLLVILIAKTQYRAGRSACDDKFA